MAKYELDSNDDLSSIADQLEQINRGVAPETAAAATKGAKAAKAASKTETPVLFYALGGVGALILIGIVFLVLGVKGAGPLAGMFGSKGGALVKVPNLVGQKAPDAVAALRHEGLQPRVKYDAASDKPAGTVTGTTPGPGARVPSAGDVTITIAGKDPGGAAMPGVPPATETPTTPTGTPGATPAPVDGMVPVPNVVEMTAERAKTTLEEAGLKVKIVEVSRRDKPDQVVVATNPGQGAQVAPGSEIELSVNKQNGGGSSAQIVPLPDTIVLKNYTDKPAAEVEDELRALKLQPQKVTESTRVTAPGNVLRTDPPANTQLKPGDRVTIVVAKP